MANNYAKSWTDCFNDPAYQSLTCLERGFWHQLYIYAKLKGDTGYIFARNLSQICSQFALDLRTGRKIVARLQHLCLIEIMTSGEGLEIKICKYEYNQRLRRGGVCKDVAGMSQNSTLTRPDQTIPDQTTENFRLRAFYDWHNTSDYPQMVRDFHLTPETLVVEFNKMIEWLKANPDKKQKADKAYRSFSFVANWLKKLPKEEIDNTEKF